MARTPYLYKRSSGEPQKIVGTDVIKLSLSTKPVGCYVLPNKLIIAQMDNTFPSFTERNPSPSTAMGHTLSNHFERSRLEGGEAQVDVTCLVSQCLFLPAHPPRPTNQATYYTCLHIQDDTDGYCLQLKLQPNVLLQSY